MTIYFDIDSTLFTTGVFMQTKIFSAIEALLGVSNKELQQANPGYFDSLEKGTDFNFKEYSAFLAATFGKGERQVLEKEITSFFLDRKRYAGMVYPEVVETLQLLSQKGHTLGIFSEGFTNFQTNKISFADLLPFFDPNKIHISRRKMQLEVLSLLDKNAVIVDDKTEYLVGLDQTITPLWINRYSTEKHPTIKTIHSLAEMKTL